MKINSKKIISALCFMLLLYIDKVVGTESQFIWLITNNLVGVGIAVLTMSAFTYKDFLKPFYIIWSVAGLLGVVGGHIFWFTHQVGHLYAYWATIPLNIWFIGLVVFKYIEKIFITKQLKIKFEKWEYVFILCMLLMLLSRSNSVWPVYYLIVFLLFWHAPFSENDKKDVFSGMLNGIILGFILLQSYAFIFTPYTFPRYRGAYWNSNRNACMYMIAFVAVISDIYILSRKTDESGSDKKQLSGNKRRRLLLGLLSVVLIGLTVYTGCRTAIIGLVLIALFYGLYIDRKISENDWKTVILKGMTLLVLSVISIPLLYFPIRYIQEAKGRTGAFVKSLISGSEVTYRLYDESYVTFDEAMDSVFLRLFKSDASAEIPGDVGDKLASVEPEPVYGSSVPGSYTVTYTFANYPEREPVSFAVPQKYYTNIASLNHRINIYLVLLRNLNLSGHLDDELSIDIVSDVPGATAFRLSNAQNFILHYLFVYGVIIGLLCIVLLFLEIGKFVADVRKAKTAGLVFFMFALVYLIMGIMEVVWIPGQLIQILLFVAPLFFTKSDHSAIL